MQLGWARQSKTSSWWSTSCARKLGADRRGSMVASAATRFVPERVIVESPAWTHPLTDARVAELRGVRARTSAGEFSAQPPCGYHPALAWICRAVSVGFGGARRLMLWSMLVCALAGFRCAVWLGCRTARSCLSLARDVTGTAWSRGYDLTVSLL
jgi:hypothetical protein